MHDHKDFSELPMKRRVTGQRVTALALLATICPSISNATIVEFQTNLGNFEVNLYDNATPATVANFLNYVNNGRYTSSVIHRSVPGFVVQGGGFVFDTAVPLDNVPTFPAVVNEPEFANVRGTIAMAKLGGDPNSATSQWFFNLSNNTANLDAQNGGFTAFGEVVGDGMTVVDAIAALPRFNFGSPTDELPLRNYTQLDFEDSVRPDVDNFVIISAIVVTDTTVDSAAGLNPPVNTSNQPAPPNPGGGGNGGGGGGGGGGALGYASLLILLALLRRRSLIA